MKDFANLEGPISDTALASQVLNDFVEGLLRSGGQTVMTDHEADLLAFLANDLCKRTGEVRQAFYETLEETKPQEVAKAA